MSLRLWVDEDTPDHQSRTEHETWREYFLNPTDVGGIFTRATLLCILLVMISVLGAGIEIGAMGVTEKAISVWAFLLFLTATSLSVFGYTVWSFIEQRRLKSQLSNGHDAHVFIRPIRAVKIAFADGGELNEYEARIQKTVLGLTLSLVIGYIPVQILSEIPLTYLPLSLQY